MDVSNQAVKRWVSLPIEDGNQIPKLWDGDSYLVRLADGLEVWAQYIENRGCYFAPCDDDGEVTGPGLSDVVAVQVNH